ncbi:Hypothetical protein, putative [Bodo saltans]|uniref:Autophagy-related protein 2 n=1 Tax=Bodo saltans TaxID=75058 RepID=A0A0S4JJL3_BODSA|nr:Hypothetical protein, putative [Bodo saltans]|eukprot:CUG89595.1 Hypothetical protein, putative [Bodo saltans]
MDIFSSFKKRSLLLLVKCFLGRFFKDIRHSQLDDPVIDLGSIGMSFRLVNLELNTELFNTQILHESPFRLVSGTINEISGKISVGNIDARSLEMEGIEVVVRLLSQDEIAAAAELHSRTRRGVPPSATNRGAAHGGGSAPAAAGRQQGMYESFMTGAVPVQDLLGEPASLPDFGTRAAHDESSPAAAAAVTQELDALSSTLKEFMLSLRGKIRHVTIRVQVPPPPTPEGQDSGAEGDANDDTDSNDTLNNAAALEDEGEPAAPNRTTIEQIEGSELLIHLQGEVELSDETQAMSFGNSFRKRIRFAGLRVCVYDALEHAETADAQERNVKLEDTILSGDLGTMENEISIQYVDVDRMRSPDAQPTWKVKVSVKQVHGLLSPSQVARVSMILNGLCFAGAHMSQPSSDHKKQQQPSAAASGKATASTSETPSRLTVQFDQVSCCVLVGEEVLAMRDAWAHVGSVAIADSLQVPHYGIRGGGLSFHLRSGSIEADHTRDPLGKLFSTFGSQYVTLKVDSVEVIERRPNIEPTVILRVSDDQSDMHSSGGALPARAAVSAPVRVVIRTTVPLLEADLKRPDTNIVGMRGAINTTLLQFARDKGVLPTGGHSGRGIIYQHTNVSLAHVDVRADVEMLDRLLEFYNIVDANLYRVTRNRSSVVQQCRRSSIGQQRQHSQSSRGSSAGGAASPGSNSPFKEKDDFFAEVQRRPLQRFDVSALVADPQSPARHHSNGHRASRAGGGSGSHRAIAMLPPVTLNGIAVETNNVVLTLSFPVDRVPNIDMYGPLTQRLFSELVKISRPSGCAEETDATRPSDDCFMRHDEHHHNSPHIKTMEELVISKTLRVELCDVEVLMPVGTPHLILANVRSAGCSLVDEFEGSKTQMIHAVFDTMDGSSDISQVYGPALDAWMESGHLLPVKSNPPSEESQTSSGQTKSAVPLPPTSEVDPRIVCGGPSLLLRMESGSVSAGLSKVIESLWTHVDLLNSQSSPDVFSARENELLTVSPLGCAMRISQLSVTLHQDELLLLLFLVDQIIECVGVALETHETLLSHMEDEEAAVIEAIRSAPPSSMITPQTSSSRRTIILSAPPSQPTSGRRDAADNAGVDLAASSLFCTPRSARSEVPASYIREQILQRSKAMSTSVIGGGQGGVATDFHQRQSVWGKSLIAKSNMFYSVRSHTSSEGSGGFWGSSNNRRVRDDDEGSPIAIHVFVESASMTLYAPRLTPGGTAVGEPLHMLLPMSERLDERYHPGEWLYHTYVIDAHRAAVVVTSNTIQQVTTMNMNLRLERIDLAERLCPVPSTAHVQPTCECTPPWGGVQLLLQGYGDTYNKSHRVAQAATRQTILVRIGKQCDMEKRLQAMNVTVHVDRCCLYHQPAHEGDHWLFVLMNFVGDSPVAGAPDATAAPAVGSPPGRHNAVACPLSFSTTVKVTSNDFLVQYRPLGRSSVLLVTVPKFSVDVGPITADPSVRIGIHFDRIAVMVHHNFIDDVLAPHGHRLSRGVAAVSPPPPSTFGSTRRGVSADLEALGFVQVLCAGTMSHNKSGSSINAISIRIRDDPLKPVFVHVEHVKVELSCAYDSFYYFQLIQTHFGAGVDQSHLPKPFAFAAAYSPRYLPVGSAAGGSTGAVGHDGSIVGDVSQLHGAPLVVKYVNNVAEDIAALLTRKLEPRPAASSTTQQQQQPVPAPPRPGAVVAPLPRTMTEEDDDFYDEPMHQQRITDSQLDDFVDVSEEIEAVRKSEAEAQKMPFWEIVRDGDVLTSSVGNSETSRYQQARHHDPLSASSRTSGGSPATTSTSAFAGTVRDVGIVGRSARRHFSASRVLPNAHEAQDPLMCPRKLFNAPPIAVEIVVSNCSADVKLYGGSDFGLGFFAVHDDNFTETFAFFHRSEEGFNGATAAEVNQEENDRRANVAPFEMSLASHPPGRRVHENVQLALRHIFVQVDLFAPGHDQSMQLLTLVRDIEVRDAIYGSPVQTILMCSIPRELRDQDGWAFEMKWVTRTPLGPSLAAAAAGSADGANHAAAAKGAEEDISVRLQPMVLTIHRKVIDVLLPFIELPEIESAPSAMFFRRLVIHPLRLRLNILFEVENYKALFEGERTELANLLPCVQDSRVWMPLIILESFPVEDFAVRMADAMAQQVGMLDALWMLLCGIQPIRAVAEASMATAGLVLMPLEDYKRNKNLYRGILKGMSHFARRVGGEAAGVVGGAARTAHETLHLATANVRQQQTLSRGNQPRNFVEGVYRGANEIAEGFRGVGDIVRYCFTDDGRLSQLPLAAVAPVDGLMRGLTQMFTGARNSFRPDTQMMEGKIYKQ